ncbi:hypothetical protein CCR75_000918 [Bremia lactucae]|uniref:BED-type domain-containing protein n=1 Tax=Bremia lactucae TaxID=4779 RepID=A0A976IED3_BRELC|nr:hypothetical protein CCR75_000918 [Bremia lactucae]
MQKRTGRPVHPLWAHFHRGEKRNRYHYHAYCSYCVIRYGMDRVPPTRGVSSDLLRHLESCPNCPRSVVESVRELCEGRIRASNAKKNCAVALNQVKSTGSTNTVTAKASGALKRTASEVLEVEMLYNTDFSEHSDTSVALKRKTTTLVKCLNVNPSRNETPEDVLMEWKRSLLQVAITAGVSPLALQTPEFHKLLQVLNPFPIKTTSILDHISSPAFLIETSATLAHRQLYRLKQEMLDFRVTRGVTLSITCWRTLELHNLVAFTLTNEAGEAACVRVDELHQCPTLNAKDLDTSTIPSLVSLLTYAIEKVLTDLIKEQNIHVIGMVPNSALAFRAAQKVCQMPQWRSLILVPCIVAQLTVMAGTVLTHERYCATIGDLIEVASYFSNHRLQELLRVMSGDTKMRLPIPIRADWNSFITCVLRVLDYQDVITAVCTSHDEKGVFVAPWPLRKIVLDTNVQFWNMLQEVAVLVAPLREAYSLVVFQASRHVDASDTSATTVRKGLTLGQLLYQLSRLNQQYTTLVESVNLHASPTSSRNDMTVVARQLMEVLHTTWQCYDLPLMVLAYVLNIDMDQARLDTSNNVWQWQTITTLFSTYFQRWFGRAIPENKVEASFDAYQHRQWPFDADTMNSYTDKMSFYTFVSDTHFEMGALCCRLFAMTLACVDLRRFVRGVGFLPFVTQSTARRKQVEMLLHVGFATTITNSCVFDSVLDVDNILPDLVQANRPEDLLCRQDDWKLFAKAWRQVLVHEMASLDIARREKFQQDGTEIATKDQDFALPKLFCETLPPLPAASVVTLSPHSLSKEAIQESVAL